MGHSRRSLQADVHWTRVGYQYHIGELYNHLSVSLSVCVCLPLSVYVSVPLRQHPWACGVMQTDGKLTYDVAPKLTVVLHTKLSYRRHSARRRSLRRSRSFKVTECHNELSHVSFKCKLKEYLIQELDIQC